VSAVPSRAETQHAINAAITAELDRHEQQLTAGSTAQRTAALRSIIRVGANTSYQTSSRPQNERYFPPCMDRCGHHLRHRIGDTMRYHRLNGM